MRINKYIAASGYCSRRKADELIAKKLVRVNGAVLEGPGYEVQDGDRVEAEGHLLESQEALVYYALNKPRGYITTVHDESGRPTVMDLMTDVTVRIFPVGRLDYDSAGLLLMTNDGALSQRIAHPKHHVWKTYEAEVCGELTLAKMERFRKGVVIDRRMTAPAEGKILKQKGNMFLVEVKIREGRNRQIRKMFEALGCKVTYLERKQIGEVRLGHLHEGTYRKLTPWEIEYLKNC